jgi:acetylornithine deacetylase/succinyl-diaminopimelate desuccinylase-like protein
MWDAEFYNEEEVVKKEYSFSMASLSTVDLQRIFSYIDEHQQEYLARLVDYLRRPSISAYGEGIGEVALYLEQRMREIGLQTQVVPTAGWPMVMGQRLPHSEKPTLLFYGHYDVQPPDPLDAWISPPFEPTIREGRLYARGVGDNKGQHFAHLLALEAWLVCLNELPCNVKVLLEGEEEIGSPQMPIFIREHSSDLRANLVVISDGPVDVSGRSVLSFGVRGVLSFELRARGANRDLHSGNWGEIPPNPLWTLVHLLATMRDEQGKITIEGFYNRVQPLTEREQQALAQLPLDEATIKRDLGIQYFAPPRERPIAERLAAWPTLTINGLHGGYGGPGSKTVLPGEAVAKCDIRLVESQSADEIFALVKAHVQKHAPDVEIIHQGAMDPSKTPLDSPYALPLQQAIRLAQGQEPLLVPAMGGSLPQYVFTKTMGLPVFGVPYANADEANHAPNENMEIWRFFQGIKTSAAILATIGAGLTQ